MNWLREADAEPIPGYRLIEPLGSGGYGEVWKCTAPGGILKAIKFVYGDLNAADGDGVSAEQEQKALQRVKDVRHPFVLSMDRIEVVGGELAIVMELADQSLHDLLIECQARGQRGIPRNRVIRYLLDAADGLDHLIEKHNLQHLDVKPRNLFVIADRVKVADFGLVKHLERSAANGMLSGISPVYAAPETFTGKISKQSDQYSLAIVYCELLTGRRPFVGRNIRQLALQHMAEAPDLTMLPDADRAILAQALAKDPTKRFSSCAAFVKALAPNVTQTIESIDLEAADIGAGPNFTTAPKTERISQSGDDGPQTAVLKRGVPTYRVETADDQIFSGDEEGESGDLTGLGRVRTAPRADTLRREPVSPEEEVDLGAPTTGPRPDLSVSRVARGLLRPTLFLGFGAFGRRALAEIRCRILDRFGDPEQVPSFRYLYIDSDTDSIDQSMTGTPEVALSFSETFLARLQPVINYRRRMIDHLNLWLPKEKLHSIPRSLQPQGSRALGRLCFIDNFARFQTRLRRELQIACMPDSMEQSMMQTGLSAGKPIPRVFVIGSACGGSGGALSDAGYAVRRLLRQLNFSDASLTLHLYCGSPRDNSSSRLELANAYATLVELNHYRQPDTAYDCHYGPDGPHITDQGPPFDATYLVCAPERSFAAVRDTVAHLATYVTQDVSSQLSLTFERVRKAATVNKKASFRSFGTFTAWFPRGLLLRVAARKAVARLIDVWQSAVLPKAIDNVDRLCAKALADPGLRWEALSAELNRLAGTSVLGQPIEATDQFLERIEKEAAGSTAQDNPGGWATQALDRVRRWAGAGTGRELEALWKKSQFNKTLTAASQQLGAQWDEYLCAQIMELIRRPGNRLAAMEAGCRRLIEFCDKAIRVQWDAVERHYQGMKKLREDLEASAASCQSGVKILFGANRAMRTFLDLLGHFARQRIAQDLLESGVQFFMTLRGRLEDRLRDLSFARQRLKHLRQVLAAPLDAAGRSTVRGGNGLEINDPFWEAVSGTSTVQIVLPAGIHELEHSAEQFVQSLRPEHWLGLDEALQAEVLAPHGELHIASTAGADVANSFGRPLIEQASWHLGTILPITDVAQVEFSAAEVQGAKAADRLATYVSAASPLVRDHTKDQCFILIPESTAGQAFGVSALTSFPTSTIVSVTNPIELTVLREQASVSDEAIDELFGAARDVYQEVMPVPALSPHARFDITNWKPLRKAGGISDE